MDEFLIRELESLEIAFMSRMKGYFNLGLSDVNLARLFAEMNFFAELQAAGLTDILTKMEGEYSGIISEILDKAERLGVGVEGLNLADLRIIAETDYRTLLRSAEAFSDQFKSRLLKGFITGENTTQIISSLSEIGLKNNQLIAAVNTARDEFQATTTALVFEENPDQRFKLTGPLDTKTRCQCKAVLTFQPKEGYTKSEIDSGAWTRLAKANCPKYVEQLAKDQVTEYTFTNRGGYNCRHYAEPV